MNIRSFKRGFSLFSSASKLEAVVCKPSFNLHSSQRRLRFHNEKTFMEVLYSHLFHSDNPQTCQIPLILFVSLKTGGEPLGGSTKAEHQRVMQSLLGRLSSSVSP